MTLDQALHILLMYSANDAAMLIAENVGGSVDHFVEMMNEEAMRLGATNTSFANPHGLSDDNHFTTAYDLYLIFNEAIKYDSFNEIIHMTSYQTTFYDKDGKAKERYDECGRTLPDSAVQRCERRTVYIRYIEFIGQRCPIS